jgi:hypothetical protein
LIPLSPVFPPDFPGLFPPADLAAHGAFIPSLRGLFERRTLPPARRAAMHLLHTSHENNAMALWAWLPSNWYVRSIFDLAGALTEPGKCGTRVKDRAHRLEAMC